MALSAKEKSAFLFLAQHLAYGLAAAFTFGGAVLYTDLSHIRTLAMNSSHPVLVIVLMFFGLCITFGSVGMVVGVMGLARYDDHDPNQDVY